MDTFYTRQNTTRNAFPRTANSSVSGYNDYTSDFGDFHQANSATVKAKKRKWNVGQSIYDINCYSEVPMKKVVSSELYYQHRPAETIFELDLSTLCPRYSNEIVHSKVGSNKSSSNEQRSERVLSLLGPLFTSGSESPTIETFRKILPSNGSPYSNEYSIEEDRTLPELGMSPKRYHKTDLNLFGSDSLNSKHAKTTLSYLFPLTNKSNRERYIDDPMDYIEDEESFYF